MHLRIRPQYAIGQLAHVDLCELIEYTDDNGTKTKKEKHYD